MEFLVLPAYDVFFPGSLQLRSSEHAVHVRVHRSQSISECLQANVYIVAVVVKPGAEPILECWILAFEFDVAQCSAPVLRCHGAVASSRVGESIVGFLQGVYVLLVWSYRLNGKIWR